MTQARPYDKLISEKQTTIFKERDNKVEKPEYVKRPTPQMRWLQRGVET